LYILHGRNDLSQKGIWRFNQHHVTPASVYTLESYGTLKRHNMGEYDGMTTNERLWKAKLLDAFESAAKNKNREALVEILKQVEIAPRGAESIADDVLKNPKMYGF
jgi:hypothetical protein